MNILVFALYTYVDGVTILDKPKTYRVSLDFLTCNKQTREVSFQLNELDSADWWLERYELKYTDRNADLHKVHGFAFNNSLQSPRGQRSRIHISELVLISEDRRYFWAGLALTVIMWLIFAYYLNKEYIQQQLLVAKEQIKANRPLVAYQKLSITQNSGDLNSKLLKHVATEYVNPDISIP